MDICAQLFGLPAFLFNYHQVGLDLAASFVKREIEAYVSVGHE